MSGRGLTFRRAVAGDVPALVALLADDVLGVQREQTGPEGLGRYDAAFALIDADPNQFLCVAEREGQIAGTLQLSFIPGLARGGAMRGQIEAVRVAAGMRGHGIGRAMFDWAIAECRARGCALVQLTTDRSRADAHRFYDGLGFVASHVGYKKQL
ncbi:GNAT family N-acetyltransferase [Frigidibacter albus]|uniref:GNAT family N-acetyltransferase n=1 Tax=Frigidibacter albus TaxID=1465486 RepID=A0A6L8VGD8_9RHOB|nr:GNAT family N-acetyltransferase [Frigidibacter albus]MZQ89385.1 GNAT family N-acetyltransferase [Frigidibacter albus]NBE31291.1 GNAT family N-acetyltransferase [Frigidibacter albus]